MKVYKSINFETLQASLSLKCLKKLFWDNSVNLFFLISFNFKISMKDIIISEKPGMAFLPPLSGIKHFEQSFNSPDNFNKKILSNCAIYLKKTTSCCKSAKKVPNSSL